MLGMFGNNYRSGRLKIKNINKIVLNCTSMFHKKENWTIITITGQKT